MTTTLTRIPSVAINTARHWLLGLALSTMIASSAQAVVEFTFTEVGSDLLLTTSSGSVNLTDLTYHTNFGTTGFVYSDPTYGVQFLASGPSVVFFDQYNLSAPIAFPPAIYDGTTSTFQLAASGSNSAGLVLNTTGEVNLFLPAGYVSNSPIGAGNALFTGVSYSTIGLIPGSSMVIPLGNGDSITVQISAAVPEPSTWISILGIVGLMSVVTRRVLRGRSAALTTTT